MTSAHIVDLAQVIGAIATALSVAVAVAIYINDYLRKQAEYLWQSLFKCEHDFREIYREFDQGGLTEIVSRVLSHKKLVGLYDIIYSKRAEPEKSIEDIIESHVPDISYAIQEALTASSSLRLTEWTREFEAELYRIQSRYPILHAFLRMLLKLSNHAVGIGMNSGAYMKLIKESILRMKKLGDLEKRVSAENLHSYLAHIVIVNLTQITSRQRLNELLSSLILLQSLIFNIYREGRPFGLWLLSRKERRTKITTYDKETISESFKSIKKKKKKALGRNFMEAAGLAGKAEAILKLETEE